MAVITMTHFLAKIYFPIMIGWFMKTYLHKPIKILEFLSRGKIQKCLT